MKSSISATIDSDLLKEFDYLRGYCNRSRALEEVISEYILSHNSKNEDVVEIAKKILSSRPNFNGDRNENQM